MLLAADRFLVPQVQQRPAHWSALVPRKRPLYPWQAESLDFLWARDRGLCFDDPGMGKTAIAVTLATAAVRAGLSSAPAIVAPASILTHGAWSEELDQIVGAPPIRMVSYERLAHHPELLDGTDWIWCDECHHARTYGGKARTALDATKAICRYGATATPLWTQFSDMMPVLRWLGVLNATALWIERQIGYTDDKGKWLPIPALIPELRGWIAQISTRHHLGMLHLPDQRWVIRHLHQDKIGYTLRLARRWNRLGRKVLIFSQRLATHYRIKEALQTPGICGDTPSWLRTDILKHLETGQRTTLPLTYNVGGEGWSVPSASVVICAELPWTHAALTQAVSRVRRPTQTKNMVFYILIGRGTTDEQTYETVVYRQEELGDRLLGRAQSGVAI